MSDYSKEIDSTQNHQLHIRFERNLDYVDFILFKNDSQTELVHIEKPLLLWDPIQLKNSRNYELISSLFGFNTVIEYDNISISWNEGVWPPSIDSLQFMRILKQSNLFDSPLRSVVDLGCGTGVLGIYLGKNNPQIEQLHFVDISPRAIELSKRNVDRNKLEMDVFYYIGDSYSALTKPCTADLVMCAPPYIPKDNLSENTQSHVAGTKLLIDAILRAEEYCKGELMILYSSMVWEEVSLAKKEAKLTGFAMIKKRTPFRVPQVLNNPIWLKKLVEGNRLDYESSAPHGYHYWHTLIVERISCV